MNLFFPGDYSKSRLHDHEAAKCLLSLSRLPIQQGPGLIPRRPITYPYADQFGPDHKIPSITSNAKIEFRPDTTMDQYYSASSSSSSSSTSVAQKYSQDAIYSFEDSNMPIDLRKPKETSKREYENCVEMQPLQVVTSIPSTISKPYLSDVVAAYTAPASLLTSLVSITEKVPLSSLNTNSTVDNNGLFQTYLTERALLDSKMKQSQMHTLHAKTTESEPIAEIPNAPTNLYLMQETAAVPAVATIEISQQKKDDTAKPPLSNIQNKENQKTEQTNTVDKDPHENQLSSVKINNLKLDSLGSGGAGSSYPSKNPVISNESSSSGSTQTNTQLIDDSSKPSATPQQGNSAKSVASEYLKMTSAEYLKAHNKSDRECTDDSDSDGEINVQYDYKSDVSGGFTRTVVVEKDGFKSGGPSDLPINHSPRGGLIQEDRRSICAICSKTFPKKHQMILHMNIHYMERKFRCEVCGMGFRTQGHLQKHERSEAHKNKNLMISTFGVATTSNPRPFECADCKTAFRIHGHLAKHLRSKTHVQKLECLQKLPFGTYAEIERAGISLTDIDTSDCDNSLTSLKLLAQKLLDKDASKLNKFHSDMSGSNNYGTIQTAESNSDDGGEPIGSPDTSSGTDEQSICTSESYSSAVYLEPETISLKRKISESSSSTGSTNILLASASAAATTSSTNTECQEKRLRSLSDT